MECLNCGLDVCLPTTFWVKHEIVIDEEDGACLRTSRFCNNCIEVKNIQSIGIIKHEN